MSIDEWFKEFGKNTSNLELIKYCQKLKIHNVVICMRDELTNLPKHTKNIIMNLEQWFSNFFLVATQFQNLSTSRDPKDSKPNS